ncbi:CrcB protein [Bacillus benzoevorans]|uniref:Fluoride-specific ion channel FluC n=1 Tax=Bacillus benzoevorans TaxID=1456 RepID=A0A7X0HYA1_9BACI|nr:fluoride efflux transporter CrcB [Bacillus benzoevorans]MBB6447816.1 CrcB protein [Bacillus benzoevorans]
MNILFVGLGGFIGAILRYGTGQLLPVQNGFPLPTLMINLTGCFFLAWFYTATLHRWVLPPAIRLGVGTGLIGAFTTFSTFSVETLHLLHNGQILQAIIYVLASIIGGILLSACGLKSAQMMQKGKGMKIH